MNAPPEITLVDLQRKFGAIPFSRVWHAPLPGTAVESDVWQIRDAQKNILELVDGILLEKPMGSKESEIAAILIQILGVFIRPRRLGKVLGEAGMYRLKPGLVRVPDVSFVSQERFNAVPGILDQRIWEIAPNLAVEVISPANSKKEMEDKLDDYFSHGVEEVWYVYPETRTIVVYTQRNICVAVSVPSLFSNSHLFPELTFEVNDLFLD